MWDDLLEPGLSLLSGQRYDLRSFAQELTHHAIHTRPEAVLWCDGDHGFNPYDFAELNLARGHQADHGADRVLIKRCMTAFQWDTVLTKHLSEKLQTTPTELVLAVPFDRLFVHEELRDWEQEDYVRYAIDYLNDLAIDQEVPIILGLDMDRWWHSHPVLAQIAYQGVKRKWSVTRPDGRFLLTCNDGRELDPWLARQETLHGFEEPEVVPIIMPRALTFEG